MPSARRLGERMETVVGNFRSRVRRHVDQLSPQPELIEPSIDVGDPLARAQAEYAECRKEARRAARALRAARVSLVPVLVLLDTGRLRPHSTPVAYLLSAGESAEGLTGIPHFRRSVGVTTKGHLLTGLDASSATSSGSRSTRSVFSRSSARWLQCGSWLLLPAESRLHRESVANGRRPSKR